jgi:hypothetical protein
MIDAINGDAVSTNELAVERADAEKYIRINIAKNSKGYTYETTVSLRWSDEDCPYVDELGELNRDAATLARAEIGRREKADARASAQEVGS